MAEQVVVKFVSGRCSHCDAPTHAGGVLISGSVGLGGRNLAADVKTVQAALNDEDPDDGGPVLKLAVDGIAGPLTRAAIEKYQRRWLGWADGRVDPDGPTIHQLRGEETAKKGKKAKPPPPPKATAAQNRAFIERIGGLLPQARHWVFAAQMKIDMAVDYLNKGPGKPGDPFHDIGRPEYDLMNKYFHLSKLHRAEQAQAIGAIRNIYNLISQVMTW